MNKKTLFWHLLLLTALFAVITLPSCTSSDSEPDPVPGSTFSITGEWFEDLGGNDIINFGVFKFKSDGTFSAHTVNVFRFGNDVFDYSGSYNLNGTKLTWRSSHPQLGNTVAVYEIKNLTKYDMIAYHDENRITENFHRIIDTYQMKVGETRVVIIGDSEFSPKNFSSNHERVAIVDSNGTITAREKGTAYISVLSSVGTAVIRVEVTDPNNLFCDFSKYLYVDINDIPKSFGKEYLETDIAKELADVTYENHWYRYYNLYDNLILDATFLYNTTENKVRNIAITFREGVNLNSITDELSKKFEYFETDEQGSLVYCKSVRLQSDYAIDAYENKTIVVFWNPDMKTINYGIADNDDTYNDDSVLKLAYYEFFMFLGSDLRVVTQYLGSNYGTSYSYEKGGTAYLADRKVTHGERFYPGFAKQGGVSDESFNGYEKTYKSVRFYFNASGYYFKHTDGPVDAVVLVFRNDVDVSNVSQKISEYFYYQETMADGTECYANIMSYKGKDVLVTASWNPSKRSIKYVLDK